MPEPTPISGSPRVEPEAVKVLEQALALARAGQINSVLLVTVSPLGEIKTPGHGRQVGECYIGLDMWKKRLFDLVTGASKGSGLFRARQ